MPESSTPAATDQQIVERLAKFMGWVEYGLEDMKYQNHWLKIEGGEPIDKDDWNPLRDWNHWRQVEEKVIHLGDVDGSFEQHQLSNFIWSFANSRGGSEMFRYMKADLRTRCLALISVLDSSHA